MQQGNLWIALTQERQPVGFIVVIREADTAFIVEVDVGPEHQCQGLG
ncbi:GNAT family N-acetyltransferase [uncultured Cycloclasticus sp.]